MVDNVLNVAVNSPSKWTYFPASDAGIANTTAVVIKAAKVNSGVNKLDRLQLSNASATATVVQILSGTNVIWRGNAPANGRIDPLLFNPPLQSAAGEALSVKCVSSGAALLVYASGR